MTGTKKGTPDGVPRFADKPDPCKVCASLRLPPREACITLLIYGVAGVTGSTMREQ